MKLLDICREKLYLILVMWSGRYKMMKMLGGDLEIINVSHTLKKIFEMSGITKICKIKEAS